VSNIRVLDGFLDADRKLVSTRLVSLPPKPDNLLEESTVNFLLPLKDLESLFLAFSMP